MIASWRALVGSFDRADERQKAARWERARMLAEQDQALQKHDPVLWAGMEERKRLVGYWAFLRWLKRMQP